MNICTILARITKELKDEGKTLNRADYVEKALELNTRELQTEKEKVKKLIYIMKNNHAHHDDYSLNCGDEDCLGCVLEKEMEG